MELTRRDALAALAAAGVVGGGAGAVALSDREPPHTGGGEGAGSGNDVVSDGELATLVAAAEVLYPSAVGNVAEFVAAYVRGRADEQPDHASGVADAAAYLDDYAGAWYDRGFAALEPADRDEALRRMGADTADPVPSGSDIERVRYYVVNELLFALYTTPTGGELAGIENPQGHPGGLESYQRGPRP